MNGTNPKTSHSRINPIETEKKRGRDSVPLNSVKKQFDGAGQDFISQLLGVGNYENFQNSELPKLKTHGDMVMGEIIELGKNLKKLDRVQARPESGNTENIRKMAAIDYRSEVLHGSERISRSESRELEVKISEILFELKRLVGSSSILRAEFASISIEDKPANPGKYYTTFLEWLLLEIKKIRSKVEDAGAWLSVMKSKKAQKKYGAMAKKLGTSFTLNNERTPATQTG